MKNIRYGADTSMTLLHTAAQCQMQREKTRRFDSVYPFNFAVIAHKEGCTTNVISSSKSVTCSCWSDVMSCEWKKCNKKEITYNCLFIRNSDCTFSVNERETWPSIRRASGVMLLFYCHGFEHTQQHMTDSMVVVGQSCNSSIHEKDSKSGNRYLTLCDDTFESITCLTVPVQHDCYHVFYRWHLTYSYQQLKSFPSEARIV